MEGSFVEYEFRDRVLDEGLLRLDSVGRTRGVRELPLAKLYIFDEYRKTQTTV